MLDTEILGLTCIIVGGGGVVLGQVRLLPTDTSLPFVSTDGC